MWKFYFIYIGFKLQDVCNVETSLAELHSENWITDARILNMQRLLTNSERNKVSLYTCSIRWQLQS